MTTFKGIRCPKCEAKTKVTSILKPCRGVVRRYRQCQSVACRHRFSTSEKLIQKK